MNKLYEDGRIVKGVNTTQDVGVDETPKQAKKFGNSVSIDGYPIYSFQDSVILAGKVKLTESELLYEQELYENFLTSLQTYLGNQYDKTVNDISKSIKDAKSAAILIKNIITNGNLLERVNTQLGKQIKSLLKGINGFINRIIDKITTPGIKAKIVKIIKTVIGYITKFFSMSNWRGFIARLGIYGFVKFISDKFRDLNNIKEMIKGGILDGFVDKVMGLTGILGNATIQSFLSFFSTLQTIKTYFLDILTYIRNKLTVGINLVHKEALEKIEKIYLEGFGLNRHNISYNEHNINNHFKKKLRNKLKEKFEKSYNILNYDKSFKEDAKILFKEEIETISETMDKDLDELIKKHIKTPGINYWAKILLTVDDNGLALEIEIFKNQEKRLMPFTGGSNKGGKFSFNYKEEMRDFLIDLKSKLGERYTLHLEGIPIEDLVPSKKTLREGGGAFKNPKVAEKLRRIKREEIDKTLRFVADTFTSSEGLDYNYLKSHIMGSAGKQADSGDLDIVVDSTKYDRKTLVSISERVRSKFGVEYSRTDGLNAGHLNLAIPIEGDEENGYIQVDLLLGQPEWMKFTHHSPGAEVSKYKGVFISQALGVIAKMKVLWKHIDETGERVGRIGWAYDLEKGLHIQAKLRKKSGQGLSSVTSDEFESFPWHKYGVNPPRVPRYGYINNPEAVTKILLGKSVTPSDIDTFEKLMEICKKVMGDKYPVFVDRLKESLKRSSAQAGMPKMAIDNLKIFENNYITHWEGFLKRLIEDAKQNNMNKSSFIKKYPISGWNSSKSIYEHIIKETFENKELQDWLNQYVKPHTLNEQGFLVKIYEGWNTLDVSSETITLDDDDLNDLNRATPDQIQSGICLLFFHDKEKLEGFKTQLYLKFKSDYDKILFR